MTDTDFWIDTAQFGNALHKESFAVYVKTYFRNFYAPKHAGGGDGNFGIIPWAYLFNQYLVSAKKYPHNVQKPLNDVINDLDLNQVWTPGIKKVCAYGLNFAYDLMVRTYADERRLDAKVDKEPGFVFQSERDGFKACYSEDFNIPNHANIVVQSDNSAAVYLMSDLPLVIPAAPDFCKAQRTFSIKLVAKNTCPVDYTTHLINQVRGFSL